MSDLLEGFPVIIEMPVKWGEMDAFQHVNNTVYFRWFEDGRIAYFQKVEMLKLQQKTGIGPILASTQCRFRLPLTYPDTVIIGTRIAKLEEDRFTMEYKVVSARHGKVAAEGEGVLVAYDYGKSQKVKVPDELKKRIEALEGS